MYLMYGRTSKYYYIVCLSFLLLVLMILVYHGSSGWNFIQSLEGVLNEVKEALLDDAHVKNKYHRNNRYSKPGMICSRGEAECRRVLENKFNAPFPNTRPYFLRNPVTGRRFGVRLL